MRFRSRGGQRRSDFDIVITSMLDINFLLIMFFMMTTAFQQFSHMELDLPVEPGAREPFAQEDDLIVNLRADGGIVVGEREVSLDGLRNLVAAETGRNDRGAAAVRVLLRADRLASADRLNEVVSIMQESGVGLGRFATEVPQQ